MKRLCLLSLFFLIPLYAGESVNDQIEAIQKASAQERVELMNRLKLQIASMNEEERANAIERLKTTQNGSQLRLQNRVRQGIPHDESGAMQQFRQRTINVPGPKQQGRP